MPREQGFWSWLLKLDRDSLKGYACFWVGVFTTGLGLGMSIVTWQYRPGSWVPVAGIGVMEVLYGIYLLEEG